MKKLEALTKGSYSDLGKNKKGRQDITLYLTCFFVWKFYSYPKPSKNLTKLPVLYFGYRRKPLLELHNPVAVLSIRRDHFRDDFPVLKIDLAH